MAEAFLDAHPELFPEDESSEDEEDGSSNQFHDARDEFSDVKDVNKNKEKKKSPVAGPSITPASISQHIKDNELKDIQDEDGEKEEELSEEEKDMKIRREKEDALSEEERQVDPRKITW